MGTSSLEEYNFGFDVPAEKLADLFRENFRKYESGVSAVIKSAGPA